MVNTKEIGRAAPGKNPNDPAISVNSNVPGVKGWYHNKIDSKGSIWNIYVYSFTLEKYYSFSLKQHPWSTTN